MNTICVLTDMGEEDMYENQGHYTGEGYPDQLDGNINIHNSLPVDNENYSYQDNDMDTNRSNSQSSKPYERRNKKRRPPGYYEKLQEEIEAERVQQPNPNVYRNDAAMSSSGGMIYTDMSYASQSEVDTHSTGFVQKIDANYAQNYVSTPPVQNQYVADYHTTDSVDRIAENISHVTLSNDSLSHSHMVHTKHYSHPSTFHTSPTHPSEMPPHPQQTSVYPEQQWISDNVTLTSNTTQPTSHSQHNTHPVAPIASENTEVPNASYVNVSLNQPLSGSISPGCVEIRQGKQEVIDSDQNQSNILDNMENESENIVDFASYPPLQPTSNNIPIGAPTNKLDNTCIDDSCEVPTIQDNSMTQQEEPSGEQSGSVWGKPKSWANLFKDNSSTSSSSVIYYENYVDVHFPTIDQENDAKNKQVLEMSPVPAIHDSAAGLLGGNLQYKSKCTHIYICKIHYYFLWERTKK